VHRVDAAVGVDRARDERLDALLVRDVHLHELDIASAVADLLLEGYALFRLVRGDDDLRALLGEVTTAAVANARCAPGNDDDLAIDGHTETPQV
jgi:hypothetical protein